MTEKETKKGMKRGEFIKSISVGVGVAALAGFNVKDAKAVTSSGNGSVKLVKDETLKRKIRKDDWSDIGISTWTKIKEAVEAGRTDEALDLVDYLQPEGKLIHDIYCDWVYDLLNIIAEKWGEEEMYQVLMHTGLLFRKSAIESAPKIPVELMVQINAEQMRAHRCGRGGER